METLESYLDRKFREIALFNNCLASPFDLHRPAVEFRHGEGMLFAIPLGAADVEVTVLDTTFSWTEGNFHGLAAMPFVNFCHYIAEGRLTWTNA